MFRCTRWSWSVEMRGSCTTICEAITNSPTRSIRRSMRVVATLTVVSAWAARVGRGASPSGDGAGA